IAEYDRKHPLELDTYPGPEAQIAAHSDDIAYNNHDIDDGLRAGLFAVADLAEVPLVGPVFDEVARHYPGLEESRLIHESIRRLIDLMVRDLDRKSTRLNSSHRTISYAVFCLKKKKRSLHSGADSAEESSHKWIARLRICIV